MIRTILIFSTMISASTLVGCGDGASGGKVVPVYAVTGKIEFAGAPVADAVVAFAPLDGQPVATGRTNGQGEYALTTYDFEDGAAEGKYKVMVTKQAKKKGAGGEEQHGENFTAPQHANDGAGDETSLLPSEYSTKADTPLNANVDPSKDNKFDFKL